MIVLAAAVTISAPVGATAHEPGPPGYLEGARADPSPCDRNSSSTLFETGKVRVYAMPKESKAHPAHRNPAIAGRPLFGCLRSTGRSRLLDLPEVGGEKHAYWVEVDSRAFAANGPLVASSYTQYYLDTHETWVRVRNLRSDAVIRTCFVGGGMAPHRRPRVTDIILSSNGEVAWNAEGEGPESSEDHVPGCNPTA